MIKDLQNMFSKTAVVDGDLQLTYADLLRKSERVERIIRSVTEKRVHIAILLPNSAAYVIAYCAVLSANCVVIPLYYQSTLQEVAHSIDSCDVQILLTNSEQHRRLRDTKFTNRLVVIDMDLFDTVVCGAEKSFSEVHSPKEVSIMLGTSGSTSDPKRVMLSTQNVVENARSIIRSLQYTENERILAVLPLTFASGNTSQLIVSRMLTATIYIYHGPVHPKPFFLQSKGMESQRRRSCHQF